MRALAWAQICDKLDLSAEGQICTMPRTLAIAMLALTLAGCGYFAEHPANVRPESEAVATVLGTPPPPNAQASPQETAEIRAPAVATARPPQPVTPPPAAAPPQPAAPVVAPPPPPPPPPAVVAARAPIAPAQPVTQEAIPQLPQTAPAAADVAPPPPPAPAIAVAPPETPPASAAVPENAPAPAVTETQTTQTRVLVVRSAAAPVVAATPETPAAIPSAAEHCESVAKQRAADAGAAGMDDDMQAVVRKGTYADCIAWDTTHPQ